MGPTQFCSCGIDKKVVARGMCKVCYDKWYAANKNNPEVQFKKNGIRKKKEKSSIIYPVPHVITIWQCSDGREFSTEVEALRYEIELFRN